MNDFAAGTGRLGALVRHRMPYMSGNVIMAKRPDSRRSGGSTSSSLQFFILSGMRGRS